MPFCAPAPLRHKLFLVLWGGVTYGRKSKLYSGPAGRFVVHALCSLRLTLFAVHRLVQLLFGMKKGLLCL